MAQGKPKKDVEVIVDELKPCDLCHKRPAAYDGKTKFGPWGWMCAPCFKTHGVGVGVGKGQRLILRER